jgi:AraC-like DNA-binding protein
MFLNSLFLIAALLGFICIYIIGFKYKLNRITNIYLITLFALNSIRFLLYFMQIESYLGDIQLFFAAITNFILPPCFYLYFNSVVRNRKKISLNDLKHFIIPVILFILYCSKFIIDTISYSKIIKGVFLITVIMLFFYLFKSYKLLSKDIWKRKSEIKLINNQNKLISKWTLYFFIFILLASLRVLLNIIFYSDVPWSESYNNHYWITAILFSALYLQIIVAPEFLSGYDVLQNKIKQYKKQKIILNNIWELENTKLIQNNQDLILKGNIELYINNYIEKIEYHALNSNLLFNKNFTLKDLYSKLNIPKSHIIYLFKYHSNVSFSDFKKLIRIQKAITLFEEDYLAYNTMESLALEVGFSSYSPFFKSFKTITGYSPQEYCLKLNK